MGVLTSATLKEFGCGRLYRAAANCDNEASYRFVVCDQIEHSAGFEEEVELYGGTVSFRMEGDLKIEDGK